MWWCGGVLSGIFRICDVISQEGTNFGEASPLNWHLEDHLSVRSQRPTLLVFFPWWMQDGTVNGAVGKSPLGFFSGKKRSQNNKAIRFFRWKTSCFLKLYGFKVIFRTYPFWYLHLMGGKNGELGDLSVYRPEWPGFNSCLVSGTSSWNSGSIARN